MLTLYDQRNLTAPAPNADVLSTALTTKLGGAIRITLLLTVSSVVTMTLTSSGVTTTGTLNGGAVIPGGSYWSGVVGASSSDTINFRLATPSKILKFQVDELQGEVATSGVQGVSFAPTPDAVTGAALSPSLVQQGAQGAALVADNVLTQHLELVCRKMDEILLELRKVVSA